jgi:pimeloyl-ACP methyl ester carboxylesterase
MQSHYFEHGRHRLHYVTAGQPDKPALLMIHGYTSSHQVWRTTIPLLRDSWYCVAIDLLGHGHSPIDPQGDHSIAAQGRRVLALADHLGLERFSLIGHSMGGQTALWIAAVLAPARVERVVDVAGVAAARLTDLIDEKVFDAIRRLYGTPLGYLVEVYNRVMSPRFRWAARIQLGSWFSDFDALPFADWRIDRELANRPGMRHTWYHSMNAILDADLTPHLSQISAPVLVIFGTEDQVVPISDGHLVRARVPHSQLVLIEQCGHFPMFEKPAAYAEALRAFLLNGVE